MFRTFIIAKHISGSKTFDLKVLFPERYTNITAESIVISADSSAQINFNGSNNNRPYGGASLSVTKQITNNALTTNLSVAGSAWDPYGGNSMGSSALCTYSVYYIP